ncbi:uncharacterized protein LOC122100254 isoform X2 [Dipodomys spectabilis]|uniref:uncharacterized protein LOC122100254 isoform X2 n=1 Tax=Dipodomys spectabilis TaxID=105255 RepID=UPI001C545244|nr:uncharacterized protein LOC122100254 isoform X2 [Dipodomys spectabilis]
MPSNPRLGYRAPHFLSPTPTEVLSRRFHAGRLSYCRWPSPDGARTRTRTGGGLSRRPPPSSPTSPPTNLGLEPRFCDAVVIRCPRRELGGCASSVMGKGAENPSSLSDGTYTLAPGESYPEEGRGAHTGSHSCPQQIWLQRRRKRPHFSASLSPGGLALDGGVTRGPAGGDAIAGTDGRAVGGFVSKRRLTRASSSSQPGTCKTESPPFT